VGVSEERHYSTQQSVSIVGCVGRLCFEGVGCYNKTHAGRRAEHFSKHEAHRNTHRHAVIHTQMVSKDTPPPPRSASCFTEAHTPNLPILRIRINIKLAMPTKELPK
jgi:hypothetical protein